MNRFVLFVLCLSLLSCEKDIDFALNDTPQTLVVEGSIENGKAPIIALNSSFSYYSEINPLVLVNSFVHGANVTIVSENKTYQLHEDSIPLFFGYYLYNYTIDKDSLVGKINTKYQLNISANGKNYQATTEIPGVNIFPDSIFFKPTKFDPDTNNRLMYVRAKDPAGLGNYIRYFTKTNDQPFYPGPNSVFTDEIIDGTTYTVQLEKGRNTSAVAGNDTAMFFKRGDTVLLRISNINKSTYNFWNTWEFARQSIGNPFSQPNKVLGNISNGALGAFCGYASWNSDTLFVK